MRSVLVTALAAFADNRQRGRSLRFLEGLSGDELRYIAEFLGCCVLEADAFYAGSRAELAECIARFQPYRATPSADCDHKMILLLEYLCRAGAPGAALHSESSRPA